MGGSALHGYLVPDRDLMIHRPNPRMPRTRSEPAGSQGDGHESGASDIQDRMLPCSSASVADGRGTCPVLLAPLLTLRVTDFLCIFFSISTLSCWSGTEDYHSIRAFPLYVSTVTAEFGVTVISIIIVHDSLRPHLQLLPSLRPRTCNTTSADARYEQDGAGRHLLMKKSLTHDPVYKELGNKTLVCRLLSLLSPGHYIVPLFTSKSLLISLANPPIVIVIFIPPIVNSATVLHILTSSLVRYNYMRRLFTIFSVYHSRGFV